VCDRLQFSHVSGERLSKALSSEWHSAAGSELHCAPGSKYLCRVMLSPAICQGTGLPQCREAIHKIASPFFALRMHCAPSLYTRRNPHSLGSRFHERIAADGTEPAKRKRTQSGCVSLLRFGMEEATSRLRPQPGSARPWSSPSPRGASGVHRRAWSVFRREAFRRPAAR
jgi:hypothetical protein